MNKLRSSFVTPQEAGKFGGKNINRFVLYGWFSLEQSDSGTALTIALNLGIVIGGIAICKS
jgi:hypothetical protein